MSNDTHTTTAQPLDDTGCQITGNSDMYGAGIRIGFYLQWYGSIIAGFPLRSKDSRSTVKLAPGESENMSFSLLLFITATFIALSVRASTLAPVETYIILLLIFGFHYYWIPDRIIHFITIYILNRKPKANKHRGWVYLLFTFTLPCIISCFQLWFWGFHLEHNNTNTAHCNEFGFGFVRVNLKNKGFRIFNTVYFAIFLFWSLWGFWTARHIFVNGLMEMNTNSPRLSKRGPLHKNKERKSYYYLEIATSVARLALISTIILAIELTIIRNQIHAMDSIASAGQMIPFVLGVGAVSRVLYFAYKAHKTNFISIGDKWPESRH
ncbi:hypothetical protein F5882DRAFT_476351 [Hyaloscypha sp. PMI_1271]|nr:hypothetical protein F5882DRAFT_476351 [Hyaloscypha sp. PMI_1271]